MCVRERETDILCLLERKRMLEMVAIDMEDTSNDCSADGPLLKLKCSEAWSFVANVTQLISSRKRMRQD